MCFDVLQGVQAEVRGAVGVGEAMGWLQQRARRGPSAVPSPEDVEKERTCRRFYAALILKELIDEVRPASIAVQYPETSHKSVMLGKEGFQLLQSVKTRS